MGEYDWYLNTLIEEQGTLENCAKEFSKQAREAAKKLDYKRQQAAISANPLKELAEQTQEARQKAKELYDYKPTGSSMIEVILELHNLWNRNSEQESTVEQVLNYLDKERENHENI